MDERVGFLISFLSLLVHRRGGYMKIEKLSDMSGRDLDLIMNINQEGDFVELETTLKNGSMGGLGHGRT